MPADDSSTNKSHDIDVLDSIKSREIVQEILDFGVNQKQLLTLIKLLALELDNNVAMKEITEIANHAIKNQNNKTTILV